MLGSFLAAGLAVGLGVVAAAPEAPAQGGQVRAGAAAVDASWHVGASAGQYASTCIPPSDECTLVSHDGTFDPTGHSTLRKPSYGIQSRLSVRAIVVEGPDGHRHAIVKNDFYIPQDLVYRRAAQILAQTRPDLGIGAANLTMASTHDHSSPMYSSTSWGVWTFQDVFDVRFYEYMAGRMAAAVAEAADGLVPVRVGASVSSFDKTHRHSFGPAIADDGTPAGYPKGETDHDMTVIRFDDFSDPGDPKPLANLVNFSLHPEFLEGNDLISADYVGPLQRMLDRETGAMTLYTQGAVGTSEPERSEWHSVHERLEFSHRDYAQAEFGARLMADAVERTRDDIADGTPDDPSRFVPFATTFPVQSVDRWYPGPFSHPYPAASNCRVDKGLAGDPQLPLIGLPDCTGIAGALNTVTDLIGLPSVPLDGLPIPDPGLSTDDFQALGIPVPENLGAPSYTGLQEDIDVHLQGLRMGEIFLPICSCEQWFDQSQNIETRTDTIAGNEWHGFDWGARCSANPDGTHLPNGSGSGTWSCPDPGAPSQTLPPVSDHEYARMRAQVNNPANGWNDVTNVLDAESEPVDPAQIKGNYTADDTAANAALGYRLTVPVSMANDYNGYIATYREYQRGDHYRKALTAWGPHSSDYMASRLVTIGRQFKNPLYVPHLDQLQESVLAIKAQLDTALNDVRAAALGTVGGTAIAAYEALLPNDGGEAEAVEQPEDGERFGASFFTWNGGSNFTDNPEVTVERKVGDDWVAYADQSGEVPVTLEFPELTDVPAYLLGDQRWHWTAHFEAFVAGSGDEPFNTGERAPATPPGLYRFRVEGERRDGGEVPYALTSEEFEVRPWSGITVEDMRLEPGGEVSFRVGPRHSHDAGGGLTDEIGPIDYPDSYESPARFIRERRTAFRDPTAPDDPDRIEWFCFTCSFRPWLDFGDAQSAALTVTAADGSSAVVPATPEGGRWVSARALAAGESARVLAGGVADEFGNFNGEPSAVISREPGGGAGQGGGAGAGGGAAGGGGGKPKLGLKRARIRTRGARRCFRVWVTGVAGAPVEGALVRLGVRLRKTNAAGRTSICRPVRGSRVAFLGAKAPGYEPAVRKVRIRG